MKYILFLLLPVLLGGTTKEKTVQYRSFYSEMKALEKPSKVTAFSAVQFVDKGGTNGPAASYTLTMTSTTAGNMVVVEVMGSSNNSLTSVTDNVGNTYTLTTPILANTIYLTMAYGRQVTGGATTLTFNFSPNDYGIICGAEYGGFSGIATFDASTTGTGFNTTPSVSTLTTSSGNLIVAGYIGYTGYAITAGTDYTTHGTGTYAGAPYLNIIYRLSSSTSETAPGTCTSQSWGGRAISFKDSPNNGKAIYHSSINP